MPYDLISWLLDTVTQGKYFGDTEPAVNSWYLLLNGVYHKLSSVLHNIKYTLSKLVMTTHIEITMYRVNVTRYCTIVVSPNLCNDIRLSET